MAGILGNYLYGAAYNACLVAVLMAAGQWLARAVWPRQQKVTPAPPDRGATLARSAWRGTMAGGLWAAYMIVFYTIAKGLGAWSPMRSPDVNLLATPFPFIAVVWIGLLPALREELKYRALGMGLTMRATGGRALLALLVPSAVWGFAHASYVTDPIWLRGVELTICSLLLPGLLFLKFDLTTAVMAHYSYNAALTGMVLIRSGKPAFVATGLAALAVGLAPAAVVAARRLVGQRRGEPAMARVSVGSDEDRAEAAARYGLAEEEGANPRRLVCLRAEDGELVGYAEGVVVEDGAEKRRGVVTGIAVEKGYRGRYYGTALYRALAEWFRGQGVEQIQAQAPTGNAGAATFWTVQGFRARARVWVGNVGRR